MLSVIGCSSLNDIYSFDYLEESSRGQNLIICPHPESADNCRSILEQLGLSKNFDVVTISRFMSDEFEHFTEEVTRRNKSSLTLDLAVVWKRIFPNSSHHDFLEVFDLFTDLRSFSTDLSLISDALDYFDEEKKKALYIFWYYLDQSGIYDEHRSYKAIADFHRGSHDQDQTITSDKNLIFLDFYHLSATQVDLLNALAIRNDVYLPIPNFVIRNSLPNDWINWFKASAKEESDIVSDKNHKNIYMFSEGRLSEQLTQYLSVNNSSPKFLLAIDDTDADKAFNAYPSRNLFYKKKSDIFGSLGRELEAWIENLEDGKDVRELVFEHTISEKKKAIKNKVFHAIKFYDSFLEVLNEYIELSEDNLKLYRFDLSILVDVHSLNLPRVYSIPVLGDDNYVKLKTLSKSWAQKIDMAYIVAFSSTSLKTKIVDRYPKELSRILSSVGPIKNSRVDKLFQISTLKEAIENDKNIFFIDHSLTESDPGWVQIVGDNFEENELPTYTNPLAKNLDPLGKIDSSLVGKLKQVSYTRLQTYLDCPRKYYHSYLDKIDVRPPLTVSVDAALRGVMFHSFIEKYFKKYGTYSSETHLSYCSEFFEEFLKENALNLGETDKNILKTSLESKTSPVCQFVGELKNDPHFVDWHFEERINEENKSLDVKYTGSIDLFVEFSTGVAVIDFKSGSASIPSSKAIANFKKIQTLFYSKRLKAKNKKVLFQAYLNLNSLNESLFISTDDQWVPLLQRYEIKKSKENLDDIYANYDEFEESLISKIKSDKDFVIEPITGSACTYCPAILLCPKDKVEAR